MLDTVVAGSDARVVSPVFTDLDESPAVCVSPAEVVVASAATGVASAAILSEVDPDVEGGYRVTLTAADHLGDLDLLTLTWTGLVGTAARSLVSQVGVAGGVYVSTDELARLRTVAASGSSLAEVRSWRAGFEALVERARGTSFVPRFASETLKARACGRVELDEANPRRLVSVICDGVVRDVNDFVLDDGVVSGPFGGSETTFNYAHGHDSPPPALVAACRLYVRAQLLATTSDQQRNVISFTNLASGEQYRFGTADWDAGRFTGMTDVDELINSVPDERIVIR